MDKLIIPPSLVLGELFYQQSTLPVCNEVGRDSTVIVAIVISFLSGLSLTPWTSMSASSGWDPPVTMRNR